MATEKVTPDPKKYPEWIEFDGFRFAAKVTAKSIIVHTGFRRSYWGGGKNYGMRTKDETLRYDTQVPNLRFHWHGIERSFDDYNTGCPQYLPEDHTEASEKILARLAEVREALVELDRKEAEKKVREAAAAERHAKWQRWRDQVRPLEAQLDKAVRAGDFDTVNATARKMHALYQEEPSLRAD